MGMKFSHKISQNQAVNEINKDAKNVLLSPDKDSCKLQSVLNGPNACLMAYPRVPIASTAVTHPKIGLNHTYQHLFYRFQ